MWYNNSHPLAGFYHLVHIEWLSPTVGLGEKQIFRTMNIFSNIWSFVNPQSWAFTEYTCEASNCFLSWTDKRKLARLCFRLLNGQHNKGTHVPFWLGGKVREWRNPGQDIFEDTALGRLRIAAWEWGDLGFRTNLVSHSFKYWSSEGMRSPAVLLGHCDVSSSNACKWFLLPWDYKCVRCLQLENGQRIDYDKVGWTL